MSTIIYFACVCNGHFIGGQNIKLKKILSFIHEQEVNREFAKIVWSGMRFSYNNHSNIKTNCLVLMILVSFFHSRNETMIFRFLEKKTSQKNQQIVDKWTE
jgi:hypothetical protein